MNPILSHPVDYVSVVRHIHELEATWDHCDSNGEVRGALAASDAITAEQKRIELLSSGQRIESIVQHHSAPLWVNVYREKNYSPENFGLVAELLVAELYRSDTMIQLRVKLAFEKLVQGII